MRNKPALTLVPFDGSVEDQVQSLAVLWKKLSGKDPTAKELSEARATLAALVADRGRPEHSVGMPSADDH